VKNEENRIKEWISYYLSMGFDTIFVYDNNSSDKTESIVKKLGIYSTLDIKNGIETTFIIKWTLIMTA
jgi:glycosyltransferase involved in cell wall biosynthesis